MSYIRRFLSFFQNPEDQGRWIIVALLVRIAIGLLIVYEANLVDPGQMLGGVVVRTNDYIYFQGPVDHYFETGKYEYQPGKPFAGRMPGYVLPYFALRATGLGIAPANVLLILLQWLLAGVACYYLAKTAYILFKNTNLFYITFFSYLFSWLFIGFDFLTLAESFSISALIFAVYHVSRVIVEQRHDSALWAGIWLTWAIFCRPFLGLWLVFIGLGLLVWAVQSRLRLVQAFRVLLLFGLPFLLAEGSWITRNYVALGRIIPLETDWDESYGTCQYSTRRVAINRLVNAWGGVPVSYYDFATEGTWFDSSPESAHTLFPKVFPVSLLEGTMINEEALTRLKSNYNRSCDPAISSVDKDSLSNEIVEQANILRQNFIDNHSFYYYLITPLKQFRRFIFTSGNQHVPLRRFSAMSPVAKIGKLYTTATYGLVVMLFFLSLLIQKNTGNKIISWVLKASILATTSFIVYLASFDGNDVQSRYLAPMLPVMWIYACSFAYTSMARLFPTLFKQ